MGSVVSALLEEVSNLANDQPVAEIEEDGSIMLQYRVADQVLWVRYSDEYEGTAVCLGDLAPGWWIDSGSWERLTNELWRLDGGVESGVGRDDFDVQLEALRHHLDSLAWVVRLIARMG